MISHTKSKFLANLPTRIILLLYSVIVLFPLIWTIYTSFKTTTEFYANPWSLPKQISFENYRNAFNEANIGAYFGNSLIVTVLALIICNTFAFMAAYVIARYHFPFSKLLKRMYMAALFFPVAFVVVPLFMLLNQIHLLDSLFGLSIAYAADSIPFTIYLLTGFLATP